MLNDWLAPQPVLVVVPRIATADNRAVAVTPVPFSFFSIFLICQNTTFPLLAYMDVRSQGKKKYEYQLVYKAHVGEKLLLQKVFCMDRQNWKQCMWGAQKIHFSSPLQDPKDWKILEDAVGDSFQLKWKLLRKAEGVAAKVNLSLRTWFLQDMDSEEREAFPGCSWRCLSQPRAAALSSWQLSLPSSSSTFPSWQNLSATPLQQNCTKQQPRGLPEISS